MEKKIGIRREDKSKWERRAPLVPNDVRFLSRKYGIETVVQPSPIRAFEEEEYRRNGATVSEKLDVPFIFGIKEISIDSLSEEKKYIFFSHTIKGQKHNLPMLKRMMELKNTLIDYECIVNEDGERMIAFGKYAGIAGMIETLWSLGRRLEWEGYETPLNDIKRAIEYPTVNTLEKECRRIGEIIKSDGLPEELTPFVVGITGYGNVSGGAQEVLDLLPVEKVEPEELKNLKDNPHTIYKVVFREEDTVRRKDNGGFDLAEYYRRPELYESYFHTYIPFLTVLVNAIYWEEKYPRLITREYMRKEFNPGDSKLCVIGDITCDIEGSVECTVCSTEPGEPVYVYNPVEDSVNYGVEGEYPVIMAIDILPSEVPVESSIYFSNILKRFIPQIVSSKYPEDFKKCTLPEHLKKAVILYRGELTSKYKYIGNFLREDK